MVKVSVLIDNYNYSTYIQDAVDSVLAQTYPEIEIIIVDDGSTDDSRAIINRLCCKNPFKIKAVFKENNGQASAFNSGFAVCTGEVICLLDSDDLFEPDKVEKVVEKYKLGYEYIYNHYTPIVSGGAAKGCGTKQFPYNGRNLFLVYYISKYPGDVASTLSFSKKLGNRIFPIENEDSWRIQADDWIVFSAGMMVKSCFISDKLTKYRIHGGNLFYNKPRDIDRFYNILQNRSYIKDRTLEKMHISATFLTNGYNLSAEFDTHERVDFHLLKMYLKVLFFEMPIPFLKKMETGIQLYKTYRRKRN